MHMHIDTHKRYTIHIYCIIYFRRPVIISFIRFFISKFVVTLFLVHILLRLITIFVHYRHRISHVVHQITERNLTLSRSFVRSIRTRITANVFVRTECVVMADAYFLFFFFLLFACKYVPSIRLHMVCLYCLCTLRLDIV